MAMNSGQADLQLKLARVMAKVPGFRKQISTPWRVGIGIGSVVLILLVYTFLSWQRHQENPNDKILPTWEQLWNEGVVPSFTPVIVGRRELTAEQRQAIADAGKKLLKEEYGLQEDGSSLGKSYRVDKQKQRLSALAEGMSQARLQEEVLRGRALGGEFFNELTPSQQDKLQDAQDEAMSQLSPGQQVKAQEALKKVQDAVKSEEEGRNIYRIRLWDDIKATFSRLAFGLGTAVLISLALGLLMGCYSFIDAFFYPPMAVLAKIPGTAVTALFLVLAGLDWKFYQSMILFGLIPTLTQTFYVYTKEVPEELIYKARTLGASQSECIFSVILPNILPKVVETIRLSVGPALIFLYAAELMYGNEGEGLGCTLRLVDKKGVQYMPVTYFYLVVIAFFGFAIDWGLRKAQRKLFPWYYPE